MCKCANVQMCKSEIKMEKVSINKSMHLSEHMTLGEVTKSSHQEVYNIPSHVAIENLKRLCVWLEALRKRYNERYVYPSFRPLPAPPRSSSARLLPKGRKNLGGESEADQTTPAPPTQEGKAAPPSDHPDVTSIDHPEDTAEPIIINSGYRSPELNKIVGGVPTSNHLTGCAVDIRVTGYEQAKRYRDILIEYADETKQDYDELLIERNKSGSYWLHFAVRPKDNRRRTKFLQT